MTGLKSLFCKENIKQSYIAKKLGTTQQTVSYWCNGVFQPSITQLPTIAKILNCSIEELVYAIIATKGGEVVDDRKKRGNS